MRGSKDGRGFCYAMAYNTYADWNIALVIHTETNINKQINAMPTTHKHDKPEIFAWCVMRMRLWTVVIALHRFRLKLQAYFRR
jgi:hypothetical protein